MPSSKIGRNDPCPCGSEKKYKKCCAVANPPTTTNVEIVAFRSERVIVTIQSGIDRYKVLQIFFGRDRSLFVNFPYFRHRSGILATGTIPANRQNMSQVNLEIGGKVSSHLVKYSHHPDGRAHFSQDGKVRTEVKRQSLPLDSHRGHIFSVLIQGLTAFDKANETKDAGTSPKRTTINFQMPSAPDPEAIKLVGRWFPVSGFPLSGTDGSKIGPVVPTKDPNGRVQNGFLIASPFSNAEHVLVLTCEPIPRVDQSPEALIFYGGFDSREVMDDLTKEAGFLAFIYPVSNADDLKRRIGTIDFQARVSGSG